ncbi:MAG TPA: hypothetical protein PK402_01785 [Tepidisphaeraceae bacterium]|nr:hypothetical protein [Tepidisphaeraceae bacterium]
MNSNPERRWLAIGLIVLLGVIHSVISYTSLSTKSPTYDESLHAMGGYLVRFHNDFRIDPEDPALWHRIHALAAKRDEVAIHQDSMMWKTVPVTTSLEFLFSRDVYRDSAGEELGTIVNRRRALLSVFGAMTVIGSGLLARSLARRIGLPIFPSGLFTSALLAFDPTLLAHSSIIKNDVMMAVLALGMCASLWSIGRRVTILNCLGLISCIALAPLIKFSGVLFAPIAALVLIVRSLLPHSLPLGKRNLSTRFARLGASVGLMLVAGVVGYLALWASYGFQFAVTNDGSPFNFENLFNFARAKLFREMSGTMPPGNDVTGWPVDAGTQLVMWAREHRLAPEGWLFGLLHVHVLAGNRSAYLFGQSQDGGFWYYFPVAFLLKTPAASVALFLGMLGLLLSRFRNLRRRFDTFWILISIGLPTLLLLIVSMSSGLNIGIRHILPLWPATFIAIGLFTAWLWTRRHVAFRITAIGVTSLAAIESCMAAPNFIPFFNLFCGDSVNRLKLLADSNLDWGQDLPGLKKWQKEHLDVSLYLSYFGTADPADYGINYVNIEPGYVFIQKTNEPDPNRPGVIAYSANDLTAVYAHEMSGYFQSLRKRKPIEIIGGSIFLYKWPFDMPDDQWEAATGLSIDN